MVWDSLRLIWGYFGGINYIKGFLDPFKFSQPCSALNYTFENDWQSDTLITKYNIICNGEYCEGIFCELANINSLGLAGFFIGAMTFGQVKSQPLS